MRKEEYSESERNEEKYLRELGKCELCEWRCGVDRLSGERGVCGVTIPEVASSTLHPALPASYDAFMIGCNFACLSCQNWFISQYPYMRKARIEGYYRPEDWAKKALSWLSSAEARMINADRMFFTGGEPTCSLPWCEEVARKAREMRENVKVNFDTNGFMTKESLRRILSFADSVTFDIKAFSDRTHRAITGASVEPVLRNAELIARSVPEKIWEFRILVIPGINDEEIKDIADFIASVDESLPVCFLAFRPKFVLESHPGADEKLMERCVEIARSAGLENAQWSGIAGRMSISREERVAELAEIYARDAGCVSSERRNCRTCHKLNSCEVRRYIPRAVYG